jgi:HTH-type transcriptional regulator/antitoxin HigA
MKTATAKRKQENNIDSYFELVQEFPLASIKDDKQFDIAYEFLGELFKIKKMNAGQQMYFDALCDLVETYDKEHYPIPDLNAGEMLAHFLAENNVTQIEVSRATGISASIISEILKGKRRMALSHMEPLAKFFHVPPSVFV